MKANEATIRELSSRLNLNPKEALQYLRLQENKQYQYLREQLSQIEAQLIAARAQFLDNSPQVESLTEEEKNLKDRLKKYGNAPQIDRTVGGDSAILVRELILAESRAKSARSGAEQIQKEIDTLNARLRSLPIEQKRLSQLERQLKIAEGVYNGLVAQVQETKLNAFGSYPNIQLLDSPSVDSKRTKPKPKLIILGGILSALFGSSAIVLYFYERQPLIAIKDFKSSKLPILAAIPHAKDTETIVEFEKLAAAIDGMELNNKCLMVSSSTASEGKTTVSIGLATALTSLGYQVLLVDADYHKADLTKRMGYFDINPSALSSLKAIRLVPKLDLLPTTIQDKNIAEYIARGSFKEHIDSLQKMEKYDYIIIDSPPVSLTSEVKIVFKNSVSQNENNSKKLFAGIFLKWSNLNRSEKVVCLAIALIPLWWLWGWSYLLTIFAMSAIAYDIFTKRKLDLNKPSLIVIFAFVFGSYTIFSRYIYAIDHGETLKIRDLAGTIDTWYASALIFWYCQNNKIKVRLEVIAWTFSLLLGQILLLWLFIIVFLKQGDYIPRQSIFGLLTGKSEAFIPKEKHFYLGIHQRKLVLIAFIYRLYCIDRD
jgi:Mrp family chromosome partitioning ATPase